MPRSPKSTPRPMQQHDRFPGRFDQRERVADHGRKIILRLIKLPLPVGGVHLPLQTLQEGEEDQRGDDQVHHAQILQIHHRPNEKIGPLPHTPTHHRRTRGHEHLLLQAQRGPGYIHTLQVPLPTLRKNSLEKTMNTSFLKKVFGVYRFYKDYKKFLSIFHPSYRNLPKLIFERQ